MTVISPVSGRPTPGVAWVRALLQRERTVRRRYGVAVVITALAVPSALAIDALHVHTNLLFVAAIAIAAWYGGRGPGLLSSVLSLFAIAYFFPREIPGGEGVPGVAEAAYLAAFLFVASIIGATTESLRFARAQAVGRAEELEELNVELEQQMEEVQTLSEHLQESNDALAKAVASAEQMAARTMRLQETTAALSQARTESDVADVVLGRGIEIVEGVRGVLARMDGKRFEVIRATGFAPSDTVRVCALSIDDLVPVTFAAKTGQLVWLRSLEEMRERFPWAYEHFDAVSSGQTHVAMPLRHGDEIVGALSITFADVSAIGTTDQAFTLLLAQAAADALARARSFDTERIARRVAETLAQARADVLGVVAHDLRNPLNLISSGGRLLLELDDASAAQRQIWIRMGRSFYR